MLDTQLIDLEGRRVVHVNDLVLGSLPGTSEPHLLAVDISFRTLSRRLHFPFMGEHPHRDERLLDWSQVQYFASNATTAQLHVSSKRLSAFHPADLARVLDALSHQQRDEVVQALDTEIIAATLETHFPNQAAMILEEIEEERAVTILDAMHPDAAADVVADMAEAKAEALLHLMKPQKSNKVQQLLAYSARSASSVMTSEFALVPASLGAAEALRADEPAHCSHASGPWRG